MNFIKKPPVKGLFPLCLFLFSSCLYAITSQFYSKSMYGNNASYDSNSYLLDTTISYSPAPDTQNYSKIGFDGTNYFIVWEDFRNGSNYDIYGARVTPQGILIDSAGIPIITSSSQQRSPVIAFDGINYLVVWRESQAEIDGDIYGVRVSPSGIVLDTLLIKISIASQQQFEPTVAWNGECYLVSWTDKRNGYSDIYGCRITSDAVILDTTGLPISTASYYQSAPSIGSNGNIFFVAWQDWRDGDGYWDIYGARIKSSGEIFDTTGISISNENYDQHTPTVASDSNNFLIAWDDERHYSYYSIYCARVNEDGQLVDTNGIKLSEVEYIHYAPSILYNGSNYMVVWRKNPSVSDVYINSRHITPGGSITDSTETTIFKNSNPQLGNPIVLYGKNNYLLSMVMNELVSNINIYYTYRDTIQQEIDTIGYCASMSANVQSNPTIAFDGSNYFTAWEEYNASSYNIFGTFIASNGVPIYTKRLRISNRAFWQFNPSVAFDECNYFLVWAERTPSVNYDIIGTRVTTDGIILDTTGITVSNADNGEWAPSICFGDTNYFAVWGDWRSLDWYIFGSRINKDGIVADPNGIYLETLTGSQYPAIAFGDTTFLIVWSNGDLYATQVNKIGSIVSPNMITINNAGSDQTYPAVAFNGSNYLVVWQDGWPDSSNYNIMSARLTKNGLLMDTLPITITTEYNNQESPSIAFDGTNYRVVWQDYVSDSHYDITIALIDGFGNIHDTKTITTDSHDHIKPVIASNMNGECMIVYSGWTDSINQRAVNCMRLWGYVIQDTLGINSNSNHENSFIVRLYQNSPNPFKNNTVFKYELSVPAHTYIAIYNINGQLVKELWKGYQGQGVYTLKWNSRNNDNDVVSPGVYFYRFKSRGYNEIKKMVIIK